MHIDSDTYWQYGMHIEPCITLRCRTRKLEKFVFMLVQIEAALWQGEVYKFMNYEFVKENKIHLWQRAYQYIYMDDGTFIHFFFFKKWLHYHAPFTPSNSVLKSSAPECKCAIVYQPWLNWKIIYDHFCMYHDHCILTALHHNQL